MSSAKRSRTRLRSRGSLARQTPTFEGGARGGHGGIDVCSRQRATGHNGLPSIGLRSSKGAPRAPAMAPVDEGAAFGANGLGELLPGAAVVLCGGGGHMRSFPE